MTKETTTKITGPRILLKIEDLFIRLIPCLRAYPKTQRYTLAEKTETIFIAATQSAIEATFSPENRQTHLKKLRIHLQTVTFLLRVAKRQSFLSDGLYEEISRELVEIGKMTTGWIRSTKPSPLSS